MRASIRSLLVSGATAALLAGAPGVASANDNGWELYSGSVLSATAVFSDASNSVTVRDYEIDYLVPTLDIWRAGAPGGTHYACVTKADMEVRTCSVDVPEDTRLEGKLCQRVRGTTYIHSCTPVEAFYR